MVSSFRNCLFRGMNVGLYIFFLVTHAGLLLSDKVIRILLLLIKIINFL